MNIALIAHDHMKATLVEIAREFTATLRRHTLMATGTTGGRLRDDAGLAVECLLSGPLGGDLQIGARLSTGLVDMVNPDASPRPPSRLGVSSTPPSELHGWRVRHSPAGTACRPRPAVHGGWPLRSRWRSSADPDRSGCTPEPGRDNARSRRVEQACPA
jgi:hypothetical protein